MFSTGLEDWNPEQKNIDYHINHPMVHRMHKDVVVHHVSVEQKLVHSPLILLLLWLLIHSILFCFKMQPCDFLSMSINLFQGRFGRNEFLEVAAHTLDPCIKNGTLGDVL